MDVWCHVDGAVEILNDGLTGYSAGKVSEGVARASEIRTKKNYQEIRREKGFADMPEDPRQKGRGLFGGQGPEDRKGVRRQQQERAKKYERAAAARRWKVRRGERPQTFNVCRASGRAQSHGRQPEHQAERSANEHHGGQE